MKTLAYVENLGEIVEAYPNLFDMELSELKSSRVSLITPRDEAYARIATAGKENIGKDNGTWTSAGLEYIAGELPLLRYHSRLLDIELAKKAVEANRNRYCYFSTDSEREYEESLAIAKEDESKEPSKRRIIILPSKQNTLINHDNNWQVLKFLLRDKAKKYFEFNHEKDIQLYQVASATVDSQKGTLLTQLRFGCIGSRSDLVGSNRDLRFGEAHGVRQIVAEGNAKTVLEDAPKKIVESYTPEQISKALKSLKFQGLEEKLLAELKK